jgi:phenylalanine-4-hydroxylase
MDRESDADVGARAARSGDASPSPPPRAHAGGADELVVLDPDHPGFRDLAYRARRNAIARLALEYQPGDPVPAVEYTADELEVWRTVWRQLAPLHERTACHAYRQCSLRLPLPGDRVPQLAEINARLGPATGFTMLPVAGLVSARTFLGYLARGIFLSTQYMRHHSRPLYTPEPDVIHELVGHAATLIDPELAQLNRRFGEAMLAADGTSAVRIERVYWFSLEFGVVQEAGGLKAVGAGLLSSFGELERFASQARLLPFDLEAIAAAPYDPTGYQERLFVAPGYHELIESVGRWLLQAG